MRAVIQRVSRASVSVNKKVIGKISHGLLVLMAVHRDDQEGAIKKLAEKILRLRIFEDAAGKMNCSLEDVAGSVLVVSQFTLYGDAQKGNRPSFITAACPEKAIPFYGKFVEELRKSKLNVATGEFGAEMTVDLVNDGSVTIIVDL